jgi:hypothetical protein
LPGPATPTELFFFFLEKFPDSNKSFTKLPPH